MIAIRQIVGVLLMVSFLFSNNGVTIYTNTCPMTGEVTCEYFMNSCCCSGEAGSGCCETTVNQVKYIPEGYVLSDDLRAEVDRDVDFIPLTTNTYASQEITYTSLVDEVREYPPPNFSHGRRLLIELETLII